jgi:hypothetical protein
VTHAKLLSDSVRATEHKYGGLAILGGVAMVADGGRLGFVVTREL